MNAKKCIAPGCQSETKVRYRLEAFDIHYCGRCGLLYRQPFPTEAEVQEMYQDEKYLRSAYFAGQEAGAREKDRPEMGIYRQGIDWIENHVTQSGSSIRLLDVGSGTGFFLSTAKQRGWDVEGVEISEDHAEKAGQQFDVRVHNADFAELDLEPGAYDAVTMWDLLEHVSRPWETLDKARRLLRTGGVLLVFTINSESLFNKIAQLGYGLTGRAAGRAIELLYDKRHNYYFTRRSLEILLQNAGFTVRRIIPHRAHLRRWLSEPAPWWMLTAADLIDSLSVPLGLQYRQMVFCS